MAAGLDAIQGAGGGGGDLWPVVLLGSVFFPFCANITYTQEELLLLEEEAKPSNVKHGKKLKSQSKLKSCFCPPYTKRREAQRPGGFQQAFSLVFWLQIYPVISKTSLICWDLV